MKAKNCLIFGGSGQIGRHLIRKLTKNDNKVVVVTRNIHQKGHIIKTQGNAGYIDIVEANIFEENKIKGLFEKADICINLIGILYEKKGSSFKNIHTLFPSLLAKLCKQNNLKHFIHLSALGINESTESKYAQSKLDGEKEILKNFPLSTILRPSVVYSVDDNFTTKFMTILKILPFFPLYYNGKTKFMPIYCSDLTEIIYQVTDQNLKSITMECVGPQQITLKEILQKLLKSIDKKRLLIPTPLIIAKLVCLFSELLPKPLITNDQLKLLRYDNIPSGNYKTNFDLNFPSHANFDLELQKYSYMWKEAGQFSQIKNKN